MHRGVLIEDGKINWASFSTQRVELEGKRGRPVFMDWYRGLVYELQLPRKSFWRQRRLKLLLRSWTFSSMKADLTNDNEVIWEWLAA